MTTVFFFNLGPHYARSGWLVVAAINMTVLGGVKVAPIAVVVNILIMVTGYFWGNPECSGWVDARIRPEIEYKTYITNLSIITFMTTSLVGFAFDKITSSYTELFKAKIIYQIL